MQKVFIVRWGCGYNQPESYILGLYPTKELANARVDVMIGEDEGFDEDEIWIDEVSVGANGADCFLANR
jgi:hypothetical protein